MSMTYYYLYYRWVKWVLNWGLEKERGNFGGPFEEKSPKRLGCLGEWEMVSWVTNKTTCDGGMDVWRYSGINWWELDLKFLLGHWRRESLGPALLPKVTCCVWGTDALYKGVRACQCVRFLSWHYHVTWDLKTVYMRA